MATKTQQHKISFMGIPITIGLLVGVAILVVLSSGTLVNQTKALVVSREEGDAMKARITVVETGYAKLNEKMDFNHRDSEEKMNKFRQEIQENLEKSQKNLKDELLGAIKEMKQDGVNSQAFLIQRLTELRQSQIDTAKEMREKIDAVAYGLKRTK